MERAWRRHARLFSRLIDGMRRDGELSKGVKLPNGGVLTVELGISSVMLAVVINNLSKEIAHTGAVGMIASVIILFIGHTINLALGLLGGFLQSLRLHYVEFFTKFFEGGAIQFRPFGSKNQ